jgi:hypothetical protein
MNPNVYRPSPASAIGNMSLNMVTHAIGCIQRNQQPLFHKDVLLYGRDELLDIVNVCDIDVSTDSGYSVVNGWLHLQYPDIGTIMKQIIKPSKKLEEYMNTLRPKLSQCKAAFHIRRGTLAEDSKKFAVFPGASDESVDAMILEANKLNEPVYILSDSESTKKYFMDRVPKAVSLDVPMGFTSDEQSQNKRVNQEDLQLKMNSFAEWFLMSELPKVYMTTGGINGRNVDTHVKEGITTTFSYSAALYGGIIPHYVFNDGYVFYPDGSNGPNKRYCWSDMDLKDILDKK